MYSMQRGSNSYVKPKSAIDKASYGKLSTAIRDLAARNQEPIADKQSSCGDSQATVRYLTEYLNRLVLDNCKLKTDLNTREEQVVWLQEELAKKQEEIDLLKQSKVEIAGSVRRISKYNESYIEQLKRKDTEIDRLKRQLLEAPHRLSDNHDSSDTDDATSFRPRLRYKELREEVIGKRESNLSTVSSSSLLDSARKYVASALSGIPPSSSYSSRNVGLAVRKS